MFRILNLLVYSRHLILYDLQITHELIARLASEEQHGITRLMSIISSSYRYIK